MTDANVSARQAKYFASVRATLETATGKTLDEWVAIARTCPETGHRARLKWFKDNHGLLQNRASLVLGEAFGKTMSWQDPSALIEALWTDPKSRSIMTAIDARAGALGGGVVRTARKGYTAWAREFQFAAVRPIKGGGAILGLALTPEAAPELEAPKHEPWSERLKVRLTISGAEGVDERVGALLAAAWERS